MSEPCCQKTDGGKSCHLTISCSCKEGRLLTAECVCCGKCKDAEGCCSLSASCSCSGESCSSDGSCKGCVITARCACAKEGCGDCKGCEITARCDCSGSCNGGRCNVTVKCAC